jgi:hypothetical protein
MPIRRRGRTRLSQEMTPAAPIRGYAVALQGGLARIDSDVGPPPNF